MAANTTPIFTLTPNVSSVLVTAANTSSQGGGTVATDIFKAWTAGANGGFIRFVRLIPTGTATTTTTATKACVFVSSIASGATTSANTHLIAEQALAATSADNATAAATYYDIPVNEAVPATYTVLATNYAAPAANTAWRVIVFGGDY